MQREPLTREALIAAAGALIVQGLVVWGLPLTADQQAWLMSLTTLLALIYTVWAARGKVTPLSDPRDEQGTPLEPKEQAW